MVRYGTVVSRARPCCVNEDEKRRIPHAAAVLRNHGHLREMGMDTTVVRLVYEPNFAGGRRTNERTIDTNQTTTKLMEKAVQSAKKFLLQYIQRTTQCCCFYCCFVEINTNKRAIYFSTVKKLTVIQYNCKSGLTSRN